MTKKRTDILIAAILSFAAVNLAAADFGNDLKNIEKNVPAFKAGKAAVAAVPAPALAQFAPSDGGNKWWSVNFVGSAHKAEMTAAMLFLEAGGVSDITRAKAILVTASNDETGHLPDQKVNNGGKPKDLWNGSTPESLGGVLSNYEHFKFPEAYARLGTICHLTQDQAVPTHAANIRHATNDSFEGYATEGNKLKITVSRDNGEMEPYEYYQDLQDDTRRHLASWVNPATGTPYWLPAGNTPLGQDATFGPWGRYGAGGDVYSVRMSNESSGGGSNSGEQSTASPEIRLRQLMMAGAATVGVLKSASKRLPPLVSGLSVTPGGKSAEIKFKVYENRSREISISVTIYQGGEKYAAKGWSAVLNEPISTDLMYWRDLSLPLDISGLPPGKYALDVRATDEDGNTTPDEVNTDDIAANDTTVPLTIQ